jgi:hypothetical protein
MSSGSTDTSMPAPDPGIGAAAATNAQLGNDWINFAKGAYATEQGRQSGIDSLTGQVTAQQLASAKENQAWAEQAHNDYTQNVQPLQDKYIQEAQNYDSPEKEAQAAATAKADVASTASQQLAATQRQQTAMGVNPASGRWAGVDRATGLGTAISEAGGENNARQQVKQTGLGLEANAIGIGSGLTAQAATDSGLATSTGATAENANNAANGEFIAGTGIMNTGLSGAMTGATNAGNLLQNQQNSQIQAKEFQDQLNASSNASMMGGVGSLVGTLGSALILSSKAFKTNKRAATGSLDAMRKMPVGRWNYKPGIADGGASEHIGPYAEDFKKATGLGDGKTIPMQDALGVSMGAINELAGKLDQVHKALGLNQPIGQPPIPKIKQVGVGGKVRTASVAGTKPPKLAVKKPPEVKVPPMRLAQYRPLRRLNPSNIGAV